MPAFSLASWLLWALAALVVLGPLEAEAGTQVLGDQGEPGLYSQTQALAPTRPQTAARLEPRPAKLAVPTGGELGPPAAFVLEPTRRHSHNDFVAEAAPLRTLDRGYRSRAPPDRASRTS